MEERETIDVDGKDFFIVDSIDEYYFLSEIENPTNILVFKEKEDFLESVPIEEAEKALHLYYKKHKND